MTGPDGDQFAVTDQLDVLKLVAARLEGVGIAYMLTGSLALSYYAEPRFTRDVDLVVALSSDDVAMLAQLFANDFYVDADAIAAAVTRAGMVNLIHSASIVKVDLIMRKATPHHIEEFERRRLVTIEGTPIWIVSPEDLVISKLLWLAQGGSDVHRRDIVSLLASGTPIDRRYLDRATDRLGLTALWQDVSHG